MFKSLESDPFAAVKVDDSGDEAPATAVVEPDGQPTPPPGRAPPGRSTLLAAGPDAPFFFAGRPLQACVRAPCAPQ